MPFFINIAICDWLCKRGLFKSSIFKNHISPGFLICYLHITSSKSDVLGLNFKVVVCCVALVVVVVVVCVCVSA